MLIMTAQNLPYSLIVRRIIHTVMNLGLERMAAQYRRSLASHASQQTEAPSTRRKNWDSRFCKFAAMSTVEFREFPWRQLTRHYDYIRCYAI